MEDARDGPRLGVSMLPTVLKTADLKSINVCGPVEAP
jgi:hypothetical protein